MLIVINGTLGIGKTVTSWRLLSRFDSAAMLDGDYFAAMRPLDYYNQTDLDFVYSLFAETIRSHVRRGTKDFIINWVFESATQLDRLQRAVESLVAPVCFIRLVADLPEVNRRIRTRNREDLAYEFSRTAMLASTLDGVSFDDARETHIETTSRTVEEVVDEILRVVRELH